MLIQVLLGDSQIPIQQEQELLLHQVHFRQRKPKSIKAAHDAVPSPMLVLWRGIVQVLGGKDERCEEYTVDRAAHALCYGWKAFLESLEVDQAGHQSGNLYV